jgi:hypothetical protein
MRLATVALAAGVLAGLGGAARAEPLFATAGTGTILHPLQEPERLHIPSCYQDGLHRCRPEHVYIFGINGLNPMCLGNFNGMLNYFRKYGFKNTHFGQMYNYYWYASAIREVRQSDPDARIVLIGFSLGSNSVRNVANQLCQEGVKVDLLIYLVGDFIWNTSKSFPSNVCRVVNIRAQGIIFCGGDLFFNGAEIDGAVNYRLDCRHILVPSRRKALELVMDELLMQACFPAVAPTPAGRPRQ